MTYLTPLTQFVRPPMPPAESSPSFAESEAVGLRLRSARKEAGLSTGEAARLAGISVSQLGNIERGDHSLTSISAGSLRQLAQGFGLSWPEFAAIVGPVYSPYIPFLSGSDSSQLKEAQDGAVALIENGKIVIPVYDLAAANPHGAYTVTRAITTVEVEAAHFKTHARAFAVLGDSMDDGTADGVRDGDVVLVNLADCDLIEGKVYVVKVPGNGVLLKRYRAYADGSTALTSDNPGYRPLNPDEAQIIGRVYRHIPKERDM